jgi:predicted HAD superfamily Cof-like phosphohydrolase
LRNGIEPRLPDEIKPVASFDPMVPYIIFSEAQHFLVAETLEEQWSRIDALLYTLCSVSTLPVEPFLIEVQKANMQKVLHDGTVKMNEAGKVLKPEGFINPDLTALYVRLKNEHS